MTKFWACFLLCFIAFANAGICLFFYIYFVSCSHYKTNREMFFLLTLLVSWPDGTYTLVKPLTGCPSGWSEGWRFQSNENRDVYTGIVHGHHFFGKII